MPQTAPIRAALASAFRFLPIAWRGAWAAFALAVAAFAAAVWLASLGRLAAGRGVYLIYLALAVVLQGALYRLALRRLGGPSAASTPGPGGLQWTATEGRLLGAEVLTLVLMLMVSVLCGVVMLGLFLGVAAAGTNFMAVGPKALVAALDWRARLAIDAGAAVCLAFLAWVGLRLSLALAATTALRRVQVLSAWPLTRGHVWTLLGAKLALALPLAALAAAAGFGVQGLGGLGAFQARFIPLLVTGLAAVLAYIPLNVGISTYFLDRFSPQPWAQEPKP